MKFMFSALAAITAANIGPAIGLLAIHAIASIIGEKYPTRSPSIPVALLIKSLNLSCDDCAFKLLYATSPYSSLNLLAPNASSSCL